MAVRRICLFTRLLPNRIISTQKAFATASSELSFADDQLASLKQCVDLCGVSATDLKKRVVYYSTIQKNIDQGHQSIGRSLITIDTIHTSYRLNTGEIPGTLSQDLLSKLDRNDAFLKEHTDRIDELIYHIESDLVKAIAKITNKKYASVSCWDSALSGDYMKSD